MGHNQTMENTGVCSRRVKCWKYVCRRLQVETLRGLAVCFLLVACCVRSGCGVGVTENVTRLGKQGPGSHQPYSPSGGKAVYCRRDFRRLERGKWEIRVGL